MPSIITRAMIWNPDKTLFYRQEHEFTNLSTTMEAALKEGLEKMQKFIEDMKKKQQQTPDAVYHCTLSVTGQPDLSYSEFTYDMYQKGLHAWNQTIEELFRLGEKELEAAKPPVAAPPRPDQSLPVPPPRPDQTLPDTRPRPDQSLPETPSRPGQALPGGAPPRPDQGTPGAKPKS